MESSKFITYNGGVLRTICLIYKHEDGRILHLLPICHIGEKEYYRELMEYIGDHICVYENLGDNNRQRIPNNRQRIPKNFNEWLSWGEKATNSFYKMYRKHVKRFQKKILSKDLQELRKVVKSNLSRVDKRMRAMFNQCEKSAYSITNLSIIQAALAVLLKVTFQLYEIDYITDIPNRSNWFRADLDWSELSKNFDITDVLNTSDPKILEVFRKQASMLYESIYYAEILIFMDLVERRESFANSLISENNGVMPEYLLRGRNNVIIGKANDLFDEHDEIIVFYGVFHMSEIEQAALKAGFKLDSKKEFVVMSKHTV